VIALGKGLPIMSINRLGLYRYDIQDSGAVSACRRPAARETLFFTYYCGAGFHMSDIVKRSLSIAAVHPRCLIYSSMRSCVHRQSIGERERYRWLLQIPRFLKSSE
jgi:hypothetical protein